MSKVKISNNTRIPLSARQSLEISQLQLDQRELMGADVDLQSLKLQLRGAMPREMIEKVMDAVSHRTSTGASTLTVTVLDEHRILLRSGLLGKKLDVEIEGLWFRLADVQKQGDRITLIFEDREIAVLRTYAQPIKASPSTSRATVTRAEFILRMIKEPREFKIPFWIPELRKTQPIGAATSGSPDALNAFNNAHRTLGIAPNQVQVLRVKGSLITPTQLKVASIILDTGAARLLARPILVMAIMCAIQESTLTNLVGGDASSVGVFQQQPQFGWPASRDVAVDAGAFYDHLAPIYAANPSAQYWKLIADVQHPLAAYATKYAQWRTDAERIVTAYGMPSSDIFTANSQLVPTTSAGNYEFYRGILPVQGQSGWLPENSWDCIQRLAAEVNWRAFFVSGTFYYVSDEDLFASQPRMRITEGKGGVDFIDGDYDENKKVATATVTCRIGRWNAPPGSVVELYDMGPWNGRYLLTDVERSLFNDSGQMSLEKPHPVLPEPISDSTNNSQSTFTGSTLGTIGLGGVDNATRQATQAAFGGVIPKDLIGTRTAVVTVAKRAFDEEAIRHYAYPPDEHGDGTRDARPMPNSLWSDDAHNGLDCSALATLVYKEAGCPNPNNTSGIYDGSGNTGTLSQNGLYVSSPQPGDLVMYGGTKIFPAHVAIYIGNGQVIEIGSSNGISQYPVEYRSDLLGYVTYPFVSTSQVPS